MNSAPPIGSNVYLRGPDGGTVRAMVRAYQVSVVELVFVDTRFHRNDSDCRELYLSAFLECMVGRADG